MDNITHSLAGAALAEAALQARSAREGRESPARFARLAYLIAGLANNLPDADVLYTRITPGKLGSLLHHRGHTHTLPVGLLLGAALVALAIALARRRAPLDPGDAAWLWGLGLLGPLVHMSMDGWNIYGVHPFWPLYDGWLYGDSIFILEPLLWATLAPPLLFAARSLWWRVVLWLVLAAAVFLPWALPKLVPLPSRLAVTVVVALALAFARHTGPRARAVAALAASLAVVAGFFSVGRLARSELTRRITSEPGVAAVNDLALSPLPADPLCWTLSAAMTTSSGDLVLRRATFAPFPALFAVNGCPEQAERITAPLTPVATPSDERVRWEGELRAPLARLRSLAHERCDAAAMLRFVRIPFWAETPEGTVLGDLRFDRNEGLGFAEMVVSPPGAPCPALLPPWLPPRGDVLGTAP